MAMVRTIRKSRRLIFGFSRYDTRVCASSAREVRYNALYRYRLHARNVRRELLHRVSYQNMFDCTEKKK